MPVDQYAVFGSATMFVHGLVKKFHDIDVIATGEAWEIAQKNGLTTTGTHSTDTKESFFCNKIEIFNKWHPGEWNHLQLIQNADVIDGIRFVKLEDVLRYKKILNRKKDQEHIKILEKYFSKLNS